MNDAAGRRGRIVSFYSFKGGVGRTMALANVAFLAAMSDLKVLVMDWDLEAPGLHHYFRGLIEPDEMVKLPSARGVLDLAWQWRTGIDAAQNAEEVDRHFELFNSGAPFADVVRMVLDRDHGVLDIILAGSDSIATPAVIEYERALAAFSWGEFLDRYAGGGMIGSLRQWATSNYDLILVDSRTGLADVAGICTMQLPDAVALTFVLNRQNIEGVSRVASAIKRNRQDSIHIWSVPMRVSREGTNEEADAVARALRELTRPGRLDRASTERDLKGLLIKAEPNVPFMESLSAFNETNAALDPLTANMARLATEIAGTQISIPEITEHWRDVVSSRLAPTLSTDAYLRQLLVAEPGRAAREVHGYVESAISTLAEGEELSVGYVTALAETSFALQQRGDAGGEVYDTAHRVVLLLRRLYERDPSHWRALLVQAIESTLNQEFSFFAPEDEVVALDEIDELLSAEPDTAALLERRSAIRMRAARIMETLGEYSQALAAAEDSLNYIDAAQKLEGGVGPSIARLEALLQKASAHEALEQPDEALTTLRKALKRLPEIDKAETQSEAARIGFDANFRVMRLLRRRDPAGHEMARYAVAAIERAQPSSPFFLARIAEMADAVTMAGLPAQRAAIPLLRRIFANAVPSLAQFSRAPTGAARLILALARLLDAVRAEMDPLELRTTVLRATVLVSSLVKTNEDRLAATTRRRVLNRSSGEVTVALAAAVNSFVDAAEPIRGSRALETALLDLRIRAKHLLKTTGDQAPPLSQRRSKPAGQE